MTVIDIHTHMLTLDWIELLRAHGGGKYSVKKTRAQQDAVHLYDAPFMTLMPGMWDYDLRMKNMDKAGVDLAVVSLTCPNVFWGGREVSLKAARCCSAIESLTMRAARPHPLVRVAALAICRRRQGGALALREGRSRWRYGAWLHRWQAAGR